MIINPESSLETGTVAIALFTHLQHADSQLDCSLPVAVPGLSIATTVRLYIGRSMSMQTSGCGELHKSISCSKLSATSHRVVFPFRESFEIKFISLTYSFLWRYRLLRLIMSQKTLAIYNK